MAGVRRIRAFMALSDSIIELKVALLELEGIKLRKFAVDGGEGSGNFNHEGRPGLVGGSGSGGSDSNGTQLSTEQINYFKESKVRDENGSLLVVYHGTKQKDKIDTFNTANMWGYGGLYLSTSKNVAKTYALGFPKQQLKNEDDLDDWRSTGIYEMYADLKKPFEVDANAKHYFAISTPKEMLESGYTKDKTVDTQQIAAFARDNGYDGVIVDNVIEGGGESAMDIIVFSPEQIKLTSNEKPTSVSKIGDSKRVARDGGEGSGNFDHAGRPGEVGGSAPEGGEGGSSGETKRKTKTRNEANSLTPSESVKYIRNELGVDEAKAEEYYDAVRAHTLAPSSVEKRDVLYEYMSKAAVYDGDIYRGIAFDSTQQYEDHMKKFVVGEVYSEDNENVKSWSSNIKVSEGYARMNYKGLDSLVMVCKKNRTGVPIANISAHPHEQEVLVNENTKWTVLSVDETTLSNGNKKGRVYLAEQIEPETTVHDGGPDSGNFGHAGRPGQVGGSAPSGNATESRQLFAGVKSQRAKDIMQSRMDKGYMHFGQSDDEVESEKRNLLKALISDKVSIGRKNDEFYGNMYTVFHRDMSYQEIVIAEKSLNDIGPITSPEDYMAECEKRGIEPKLHKAPDIIPNDHLKKPGDVPVYSNLSEESVLSDEEIVKYAKSRDKMEESSRAAIDKWDAEQANAVRSYTSQYGTNNYTGVNTFLETGEAANAQTAKAAEVITKALDYELGAEAVLFRGESGISSQLGIKDIDKHIRRIERSDFTKAAELRDALVGQVITNKKVTSTSTDQSVTTYGQLPVQTIFKTPASAKAVDISQASVYGGGAGSATQAFAAATGQSISQEGEVAFKPGLRYRIDAVDFSINSMNKKSKGQIVLTATVLTD